MSSLLDLVSTFVLNGSRIAIAGGSYHPRISDNYAVLQRTYGSDCECDCDCQGTAVLIIGYHTTQHHVLISQVFL